jgi:hypothetical protein
VSLCLLDEEPYGIIAENIWLHLLPGMTGCGRNTRIVSFPIKKPSLPVTAPQLPYPQMADEDRDNVLNKLLLDAARTDNVDQLQEKVFSEPEKFNINYQDGCVVSLDSS